MGLLGFFGKSGSAGSSMMRLPSGSFTVDKTGHISVSTIPQSFPRAVLEDIAGSVLLTFKEAKNSNMPLTELIVEYAALKLTARELRGGAIVFLAPRATTAK